MKVLSIILLLSFGGCGPNPTKDTGTSHSEGSNFSNATEKVNEGRRIEAFNYQWIHHVSNNGFACNTYSANLKCLSNFSDVEFQLCSKTSSDCWPFASINCSSQNCVALDASGNEVTNKLNVNSSEYSLVNVGKIPACSLDTINSFKIKARIKGQSWIEADCSDYKTIPTNFFTCP